MSTSSTSYSTYTSFSSLLEKNEQVCAQLQVFLSDDEPTQVPTLLQAPTASLKGPIYWLSTIYTTIFPRPIHSLSSSTSESTTTSNSSNVSSSSSTSSGTSPSILDNVLRTERWIGSQLAEKTIVGAFSKYDATFEFEKEVEEIVLVETLPILSQESHSIKSTTAIVTAAPNAYASSPPPSPQRSSNTPSKRSSTYSNLSGPLPSSLIKTNTPRKSSSIITDRALQSSPFPAPLIIYQPNLIDSFLPNLILKVSPSRRNFKKLELKHLEDRLKWAYGTTSVSAKNIEKYCKVKCARIRTFTKVEGKVGKIEEGNVGVGIMSRAIEAGRALKGLKKVLGLRRVGVGRR